VGIGTTNPGAGLDIKTSGDPAVNTVGLNILVGQYTPSESTQQYGIKVETKGGRYANNHVGIYSKAFNVFNSGLRAIFGESQTNSNAYSTSYGIYGKSENTYANYGTKSYAIYGEGIGPSTGPTVANGQGVYGGYFTSSGSGNQYGVYADASLTGTPLSGAVAIPLLVASGGSEKMRVDASGNVGIGTTQPTSMLHVSGGHITVDKDYYSSGLQINYGSTTSGGGPAISAIQTAGQGTYSEFYISRGTIDGFAGIRFATTGITAASSTPDWWTGLMRGGPGAGYNYGILNNGTPAFMINPAGDAGFGASVNTDASGGLTGTSLIVRASGNVGIGTSVPTDVLDIQGGYGSGLKVRGPIVDNNWYGGITFTNSSNAATGASISSSTNGLFFSYSGSERMRISSSGNVGIGTILGISGTNGKLDAAGDIRLRPTINTVGTGAKLRFGSAGDIYGTADPVYIRSIFDGADWYNGAGIAFNVSSVADYTGGADNTTEAMRISGNGNVGIGTTSPRASLDVSGGSIIGRASVLNGTSTVDFSIGNIQHTASSCGSFQFNNLKDGGTYMFIVKGTIAATCSFTAYSDAGSTSLTVHMPSDHSLTVTGKHTVYNVAMSGTDAYFSWTPGY
jgi:hypothetical protein